MPDLNTTLHNDMLRHFRAPRRILDRIEKGLKLALGYGDIYGLHWGNPDEIPPLRHVRDHFLLPYVKPGQTAIEVGPGGGRWTRYMLDFAKLYAVDFYAELLDELKKGFRQKHIEFIKNNGTDFPGVPDGSVDFVFSFGTFVHLDPPLIAQYLESIKRALKPEGNAVIQYSDQTKIMAKQSPGFSDNNPEKMRRMISDAGLRILEEDTTSMWHSSVVRFTR